MLESFQLEKPKTRELVKLLDKLKLGDQKVLILTEGKQPLVYLSARNISTLQVRPYGTESTYDVLWADSVLIEKGALAGAGVSKSDANSDVADEKVEEGADA